MTSTDGADDLESSWMRLCTSRSISDLQLSVVKDVARNQVNDMS